MHLSLDVRTMYSFDDEPFYTFPDECAYYAKASECNLCPSLVVAVYMLFLGQYVTDCIAIDPYLIVLNDANVHANIQTDGIVISFTIYPRLSDFSKACQKWVVLILPQCMCLLRLLQMFQKIVDIRVREDSIYYKQLIVTAVPLFIYFFTENLMQLDSSR